METIKREWQKLLDLERVNVETVKRKIKHLQEVIKIYLMATNGFIDHIGGITLSLIDVLSDMCDDNLAEASTRLNAISVLLTKTIYLSVIERMEGLDNPLSPVWQITQKSIESRTELLPHVEFLKSTLTDLSMATKTGHAAMLQKLGELVDVLRS